MRITSQMMVSRSLRDVAQNLNRLGSVQRDLSTGRRIHRPSDDPASAARAETIKTNLAQQAQYAKNIQAAGETLALTDTTLGSVTDTMMRLRQLAVQGSNGGLLQADREALKREVLEVKESLRNLGNTQANGRYLFGGVKTQTEPYPSDVTLSPADTGRLTLEIGPELVLDYNVTGEAVFGSTAAPLSATNSLFGVIDEFVGFLETGTSSQVVSNVSLKKISDWMDRIGAVRAEVGSKQNRLSFAQARLEDLQANLETTLDEIQNTDIAQASVRLNQYEAAFRASLAVGGRAIPMSLVDFLR